jgi:hypothetical protein
VPDPDTWGLQDREEFLRAQLAAARESYEQESNEENNQVYLRALRKFADVALTATWFH